MVAFADNGVGTTGKAKSKFTAGCSQELPNIQPATTLEQAE
jgi:hypothetical protein